MQFCFPCYYGQGKGKGKEGKGKGTGKGNPLEREGAGRWALGPRARGREGAAWQTIDRMAWWYPGLLFGTFGRTSLEPGTGLMTRTNSWPIGALAGRTQYLDNNAPTDVPEIGGPWPPGAPWRGPVNGVLCWAWAWMSAALRVVPRDLWRQCGLIFAAVGLAVAEGQGLSKAKSWWDMLDREHMQGGRSVLRSL